MKHWIGVDLDGTLAFYEKWVSDTHIGHPIPYMVDRVKMWLEQGKVVKIFTARVCDGKPETVALIKNWCKEHIGVELEVTNIKDYGMVELWDDRAVRVIQNTGVPQRYV